MEHANDSSVVIKEHDFQAAKNALKSFIEKATTPVFIDIVDTLDGVVWLRDHKVTGTELNKVIFQIIDYLTQINIFHSGIINEFGQVYHAFEALDQDYIAGILIAVKSAEAASQKAEQGVDSIQKIVQVLEKFNTDLRKLEHLMDVDSLWCRSADSAAALDAQAKKIEAAETMLKAQHRTLLNISKKISTLSAKQKTFIVSCGKHLAEQKSLLNRRFDEGESAMQNRLDAFTTSAEKAQAEKLADLDRAQADQLEHIAATQAQALDQLHQQQMEQLTRINQSLEEEKAALNHTVTTLTQRLKFAYIAAGGALAVSLLHFILNLTGVL